MNSRTSKLLRSYARSSGTSLKKAKLEWLNTPTPKRGAVRAAMESGLWSTQLRDWRKLHGLQQKEAGDYLQVPPDTYRKWEAMLRTPHKIVRSVLGAAMKSYTKANPK